MTTGLYGTKKKRTNINKNKHNKKEECQTKNWLMKY